MKDVILTGLMAVGGAGIGAATGGFIGAVTAPNDDLRMGEAMGFMVGAGIGGTIGAVVGAVVGAATI